MALVSLESLRARVRTLSDMEGSAFVADDAFGLDGFINAGLSEVYDLVVEAGGEETFLTTASITVAAGAESVPLPEDFATLRGVQLTIAGKPVTLQKYPWASRNDLRNVAPGGAPYYRVMGQDLVLLPAPTAELAGVIEYVAEFPRLADEDDVINLRSGWEEYAVLYAAIQCKDKEESDVSVLVAMLDRCRSRIQRSHKARDISAPNKVVDTDDWDEGPRRTRLP